jgi:hypothetical protein
MIDHVMRSRDGMKIHVVELFYPLGIEYCTFWFYSVVEKARHLFIIIVFDPPGDPKVVGSSCGAAVGWTRGVPELKPNYYYDMCTELTACLPTSL